MTADRAKGIWSAQHGTRQTCSRCSAYLWVSVNRVCELRAEGAINFFSIISFPTNRL